MKGIIMKDYQRRVVIEKKELDERLGRLQLFLDGDIFSDLNEAEKNRLERQEEVMIEYSKILNERIEAF